MFSICVLIVAAAAVYMVEAYIHTYYAIEYMHGTPLFFVLLAKYAAPVLFLLLCGYFVFRYREKRRELEAPVQEKPVNREEVYAEKINATVKTKAVFSDQADQMLYQVKRFGQKMAVTYSMTQNSKTSGEQAKCLTLLASAERIGLHIQNSKAKKAPNNHTARSILVTVSVFLISVFAYRKSVG